MSPVKRPSPPRRGFSQQVRTARQQQRARDEHEHLLAAQHDEEEHADSDGLYPPHCCWTSDQPAPPAAADPYGNSKCDVYRNIHQIRRDIINSIDDPYSLDQLNAPRMNVSLVRPLVDEYYDMQDLSVVYCLLVNRTQFIREQSYATHHQTVNLTRALLCELLAEKILRRYNEHNPGPKGLLKLANILVAGFEPFQNAPDDVIKTNSHAMHSFVQKKAGVYERKLTALEVAIVSESKSFLASSACQKVVDAIYRGKIIYTPSSFIDIIPDHWKRRPISLYDPRRAPLLNQYRLIVPRTRNIIEVCQFIVLLCLYIAVLVGRESRMTTHYVTVEFIFDIYATGWILDLFASILEHGWQVYTQNLWSFLDVTFSMLFSAYMVLRLHALTIDDEEVAAHWARTALDILSCAAPVLIPRLAFNFMSENMLFLSLRAMMSDFLTLSILAVWCFAGFLFSLKWLHNGAHDAITISKWMIWIWFGLDGTGIDESPDFHWVLGPVLMILFAFLGNTLFLTILVSMLSNTFSIIVSNAVQEIQYRRAVLTFEGVKSDAIFAYMPPFNILALLFLLPLKLVVSDRWFHKIHVCAVRTINAPMLILIAWYERHTLWMADKHKHFAPKRIDWTNANGPRVASVGWWARTMTFWEFSRFSVHGDIQAVFDIEPPPTVLEAIAQDDDTEHSDGIGKALGERFHGQFDHDAHKLQVPTNTHRRISINPRAQKKRRRDSHASEALRIEFADSSSDADNEATAPPGHRKMLHAERMDSMIDYNDTGSARAQEALARLHKMEDSLRRVENMLSQIVGESGDSENEAAESQLEQRAATGLLD